MILEPFFYTIRVESVATRKEQTILSQFKISEAYWTSWKFQSTILFLFAVLLFYFNDRKSIDHISLCRSSMVRLLLVLWQKLDEILIRHIAHRKLSSSSACVIVIIIHVDKLHWSSSSLMIRSALLENILEMLSRPSLTSKVLAVAHAKFLRIETFKSIAHVHHVRVVEHLMEVERSEVFVEYVLLRLTMSAWPTALVAAATLPLLTASHALVIKLLIHLSKLVGKSRPLAKEVIHDVTKAWKRIPGPLLLPSWPLSLSLLLLIRLWLGLWLLILFKFGPLLPRLVGLGQRSAKLITV